MKSFAASCVRYKTMLESALDKSLCLELPQIKSYAWSYLR